MLCIAEAEHYFFSFLLLHLLHVPFKQILISATSVLEVDGGQDCWSEVQGCSINIILELVRNANSQVPPKTY
jgi:hypothetical protein